MPYLPPLLLAGVGLFLVFLFLPLPPFDAPFYAVWLFLVGGFFAPLSFAVASWPYLMPLMDVDCSERGPHIMRACMSVLITGQHRV